MNTTNSLLPKGIDFENGAGMALPNTTANPKPVNDFQEGFPENRGPAVHQVIPSMPLPVTPTNKLLTRKRKRSRDPLRQLRIQRGFTLEELAELTGLSPSYLSRLESGSRRLNADILQKVSLVLGCHPGDLLPHSTHHAKFSQWGQQGSGTMNDPVVTHYPQDLPFYTLQENEGSSMHFEKANEWVTRPQELFGVSNAFAFTMGKSSTTSLRYRPGDRIFAHPNRPLSTNCTVLVITHSNDIVMGDFVQWSPKIGPSEHDQLILKVYERTAEGYRERKVCLSHPQIRSTYRLIGSVEAA